MAYLPLSTANLPNPVIDPAQGASPEDHFGISLWSGNNGTQSITDLSFQPDFVWGKKRGATVSDHSLFDAVRGVQKVVFSNLTNSEETQTGITSFNSNGFTMGSWGGLNSTGTYVGWSWKANGSGVSNTDGSITSTVSANTTSGFSVVTFTSNGSSGQTIGHGLGVAPKMVIAKNKSSTGNWWVYNYNIGNANYMELNTTIASTGGANVWSSTHPSSTVVYSGLNSLAPTSGHEVVMYCFAEVEGFSKMGSYKGNGSANGPFVYTGFQVKWVMYKRTDSAGDWSILDTERSTYNVADDYLYPHSSAAEASGAYQTDFLSNGFKLRGTNTQNNASGGTYIYMAFAEQPIKFSNAR